MHDLVIAGPRLGAIGPPPHATSRSASGARTTMTSTVDTVLRSFVPGRRS